MGNKESLGNRYEKENRNLMFEAICVNNEYDHGGRVATGLWDTAPYPFVDPVKLYVERFSG